MGTNHHRPSCHIYCNGSYKVLKAIKPLNVSDLSTDPGSPKKPLKTIFEHKLKEYARALILQLCKVSCDIFAPCKVGNGRYGPVWVDAVVAEETVSEWVSIIVVTTTQGSHGEVSTT